MQRYTGVNLLKVSIGGDIVVVTTDERITYYSGSRDKVTYWRSAAKPIQALPVIFSGAAEKYGLTPEEIAIMAASHSGENLHVETVKGILNKIGLDESALKCGVHPPVHKETARNIWMKGGKVSPLHNNCSGKHAGLLTLCQFYGWSIDDYLNQDHPLQRLLLEVISDITGVPESDIELGVDGCGVVVFGLPLKNMAYAYARLANPEYLPSKYRKAARHIVESMTSYPEMVGGSERFNTDLLTVAGDKLVAKSGAEGVFCIGVFGGPGVAVKIEDGNSRGIPPVVINLLKQLNLLTPEEIAKMRKYHKPAVKNNRKEKVGFIKPVFTLNKA